jgi:hypothetical protein
VKHRSRVYSHKNEEPRVEEVFDLILYDNFLEKECAERNELSKQFICMCLKTYI